MGTPRFGGECFVSRLFLKSDIHMWWLVFIIAIL